MELRMNLIIFPTPLMWAWIGCVCLIGLAVGSGLNVFVVRLAVRKSVLWPSSHCFTCFQKIHWYDNIPIFGYLLLRGRCRACGKSFSSNYLGTEVATAVLFGVLFYLEIVVDIHRLPIIASIRPIVLEGGVPIEVWLWVFLHFGVLSFSIVAFQIARQRATLPKSIGLMAIFYAIAASLTFPWPWPNLPFDAFISPTETSWRAIWRTISGLQIAPWSPPIRIRSGILVEIPSGLITTFVGFLVVGGILRVIRLIGWRLDIGSMLLLTAWGGLFGWQFGLLMLLMTAIFAIRFRFSTAVAIAPMISLISWPIIRMLYR